MAATCPASRILYVKTVAPGVPSRSQKSLAQELSALGVCADMGASYSILDNIQLDPTGNDDIARWLHVGDVVVDDSLTAYRPDDIERLIFVRGEDGNVQVTCPQNPSDAFRPVTAWPLPIDLKAALAAIAPCEIVLGLPSYNVEETLSGNIECLARGVSTLARERRCLIVVSDSGSRDGSLTQCWKRYGKSVSSTAYRNVYVLALLQRGIRPGKGSSLRTIFMIAREVGAQAVLVMDSDITTCVPGWVSTILSPIVDGTADAVVPMVIRNKYDARGTNAFAYPLIAALTSAPIRNPLSGTMGLSRRFLDSFLDDQDTWEDVISHYGIESYMTIHMACGPFRVSQPNLGILRHRPRTYHTTFATFLQVFRSTFTSLWRYRELWLGRNLSRVMSPSDYKLDDDFVSPPSKELLSQHVTEQLRIFGSDLQSALGPELAARASDVCMQVAIDPSRRFPTKLWAEILIQYLLRHPCLPALSREEEQFLSSLLIPLTAFYLSYVRTVEPLSRAQSELIVEKTVHDLRSVASFWLGHLAKRSSVGRGIYLEDLRLETL